MLTDAQEDYTRGSVPFLGTTIYLDSKPLIPRTETEYWVEKALAEIPNDSNARVLDLFSGSGCIGVATLFHKPFSIVTLGEYEERHLPTIRKNVIENGIDPERASVVQTNIWNGIAGPFEYVFANPPYLSRERNTVSKEAEALEPNEALFAEDDGFYYIEKIIEKLPSFLTSSGVCFVEHEPFHAERIHTVAERVSMVATSYEDQYGTVRYSRLNMA